MAINMHVEAEEGNGNAANADKPTSSSSPVSADE